MPSGFKVSNTSVGFASSDLDDLYVRKEYFTAGNLWGAGLNTALLLGDNTLTSKSSPVQVTGPTQQWKSISENGQYALGVGVDGGLYGWGVQTSNFGLGTFLNTTYSKPTQVSTGGTTQWKQVTTMPGHVATTTEHSAGITSDGRIWCWGANGVGQLGDGTTSNKSVPTNSISGNYWLQVSGGNSFTAALKADGTLWLWGYNGNGQLGDNTNGTSRSSPVQTIASGTNWKSVNCRGQTVTAIKTDGTLWTWGVNTNGQLGDGTTVSKSSPVQVTGSSTNWKISAASSTNVAAIKYDGTLWIWGDNTNGQLGNNNAAVTAVSSPIQTVSSGNNWRQVTCGVGFTAAIKTDGSIWAWGDNTNGTFGNSANTIKYSSPIQAFGGTTGWKTIDGFTALHAITVS